MARFTIHGQSFATDSVVESILGTASGRRLRGRFDGIGADTLFFVATNCEPTLLHDISWGLSV